MKESQHNSQLELVTVTDVICYKRVRSYIHKMTFLKPIRYTCTQAQQGRLLAVASFAQEALVGRSVTVSGCQCGQLPEINYPRDHILGSKIFPRWPLRYPPPPNVRWSPPANVGHHRPRFGNRLKPTTQHKHKADMPLGDVTNILRKYKAVFVSECVCV